MLSLSEGDASLHIGALQGIPDFFYLQFETGNFKNIGCYVAERGVETIYARFLREIETPLVERMIAENGVLSILDSLWQDSDTDPGSA